MTPQHPITPPPELVQQWMREAHDQPPGPDVRVIATQAAQWGADQRLEACLNWIADYQGLEHPELLITLLRAAMRPKPPSLKQQALDRCNDYIDPDGIIRRALKSLDD